MSKQLDTLHHVALQVTDIDKAVDWYRSQVNCEVEYQDDTWALLRFANVSMALVVPEQHPAHIAVVRDDLTPYGQAKQHRDGTASVYIEDDQGNCVEMLQLDGKGAL